MVMMMTEDDDDDDESLMINSTSLYAFSVSNIPLEIIKHFYSEEN